MPCSDQYHAYVTLAARDLCRHHPLRHRHGAPEPVPATTLAQLPGWLPKQQVTLGLDLRGGSHLVLEVDAARARPASRCRASSASARRALREARHRHGSRCSAETMPSRHARGRQRAGRTRDAHAARLAVAGRRVRRLAEPQRDLDVATVSPDGTIRVCARPRRADRATGSTPRSSRASRSCAGASTRSASPSRRSSASAPTASSCSCPACRTRPHPRAPRQHGQAELPHAVTPRSPRQAAAAGVELLPGCATAASAIRSRSASLLPGDRLTDAARRLRPAHQPAGRHVPASTMPARGSFAEITRAQCRQAVRHRARRQGAERAGHPRADHRRRRARSAATSRSQQTADLAALLRAGALPAPLTVIEERTVGADLGSDAIAMGVDHRPHRLRPRRRLHVVLYGRVGPGREPRARSQRGPDLRAR